MHLVAATTVAGVDKKRRTTLAWLGFASLTPHLARILKPTLATHSFKVFEQTSQIRRL